MNVQIIDYSPKAIALVGDTKEIKDSLKQLGGRFNPRLTCGAGWILSKTQQEQVNALLAGQPITPRQRSAQPAAPKVDDNQYLEEYLEEYLNEMRKVYPRDEKMMDWFRKEFSSAVKLSNGGLLVFTRQSIETSFCFGYRTSVYDCEDYDNANEAARMARTNEDYFMEENLSTFDKAIEALSRESDDEYRRPYIYRVRYDTQSEPLNLFRWEMFGAGERTFGREYTEMTAADRAIVLAGERHEREKFEKRLRTYLKRYGLSKIRSWSYWLDA